MLKPQPYILKTTIQHYEWGTRGKSAFIPKLLDTKAEKDKSYAELWMGAHPKSPSKIIISGEEHDLNELIQRHPSEMLGSKVSKRFSGTLPFLFKVLSANEALSIQVHPNKRQAIALHKRDPVNYPDPNYKLEIAIALDSLTALIGFKPLEQIKAMLNDYPEIRDFLGKKLTSILKKKNIFKEIFTRLVKKTLSDAGGLSITIQNLSNRISKKKTKTEVEKYFLTLHKKYDNDIGLLILFFLNLAHLKRGEAIFTKPGIPHAYLKGNILECMSNSDNVIRAGLTPKYKDMKNLLKVLTFELGSPKVSKGFRKGNSVVYKTDAKEFVIQIFNSSNKALNFENQTGPRILLILNGAVKISFNDEGELKSEKFIKGNSVFLPSILSKFKITTEKSCSFVLVSVP